MTPLPAYAVPADGDESAYYLLDGRDRVVPTLRTQSTWDPATQQGPPVCGLLGWAVTDVPSLAPMQLVRLTTDLWRPVPLRPLRVVREVRREGRRVQVVDVGLIDGDVEVAHATALRVRRQDGEWPDATDHPDRPPDAPPPVPAVIAAGEPVGSPFTDPKVPADAQGAGFLRSIDGVRHDGATGRGDPVVLWARMRQSLIAGEATPPSANAAWASDFASGLASYLDPRHWTYINPDVNLHLLREPVGEWIAIAGLTWAGDHGIGHGRARLYDLAGFVGSATAAQIVSPSATS